MFDYHIHCSYSDDCETPALEQLRAARAAGVTELCFADHVDFDGCHIDGSFLRPADIAARNAEIEALRADFPDITIRLGVEVGLGDEAAAKNAWAHIQGTNPDFVFASVHLVKGVNAYAPIYYEGRTKEEAYARYVEHIHACIRTNPYFCVLGHYDFCAKFAPYADRTFYYAHAPEHLDGIFRYLIEQGKGLEINTATWQDSPCWGLDALTRYRELGGEFVTFGSDAHRPGRVGWRINEAVELARAAGIPYTATFQAMQPTFHALDKL